MERNGRFYFFTKLIFGLIVSFFIVGIIRDLMQDYLRDFSNYLEPVYFLFGTFRFIAMTSAIIIICYFIYVGYRYMVSRFYRDTKIPVHEAFYHGYFDLAYAYERLQLSGDSCEYDTKTKSVIVKKGNVVNQIVVRDIFGRLQGEAKDAQWYIVSKKKKEYGNIRYMKRRPIQNPLYENRDYINKMKKEDSKEYRNYVCLSGLRRNTYNNEQINTVYELEAILKK